MSWKPGDELNSNGDYAPERHLREPKSAVIKGARGFEAGVAEYRPFSPRVMAPGQVAYFDVDNTLVFAANEVPDLEISPENWVRICGREFYMHRPHVETIKDFKARGLIVVVWSAGGAQWAALVVEALGLTKDVDFCLTKPNWIFDDKKPQAWLNETHLSYKEPE